MKMPVKCSHADHYHVRKVYDYKGLPFVCEYLTLEDTSENGVVSRRSVFKIDDNTTRFKGLVASDFDLQNQLAAGVDLKHTICRPTSIDAVDSFNRNSLSLFTVLHELKDIELKN